MEVFLKKGGSSACHPLSLLSSSMNVMAEAPMTVLNSEVILRVVEQKVGNLTLMITWSHQSTIHI
jgi:hypothetical protein